MTERTVRRRLARKLAPLRAHARFKLANGGRSGGKSHFFAEEKVLKLVDNPNHRALCIREVQKSLKHSAKHLIEKKIAQLGVGDLFEIMRDEIRHAYGDGLIAFTGMQDHTADSVKSFEGFNSAWFEEAQRMSKRSKDLLVPTIRTPGSELWFSWNPESPDLPIEELARSLEGDPNAIRATINYLDNPFCPQEAIDEAERCRRNDPDAYDHIWLGQYVSHSNSRVLADKCVVRSFEPQDDWDGPYHGLDFGYSQDPLAIVRCWRHDNRVYIEKEAGGVGVELNHIAQLAKREIDGIERFEIRCDAAQPAMVSYLQNNGLPRAVSCDKWSGSVKDGIGWLRSHDEIVIDPSCIETASEGRLYSYKVDRLSEQVLDAIIDAHNHYIDAIRYAFDQLIKQSLVTFQRIEMV